MRPFSHGCLNPGANKQSLGRDPRDLLRVKCRRMLVKNDGHAFREEDWQRLKRIAEGNPDETKIGRAASKPRMKG